VEPSGSMSWEEFESLAGSFSVVPVWRELAADTLTPVAAFLRLVGDREGFLLESAEAGRRWSRFSFVGRSPQATVASRLGKVSAAGELAFLANWNRGLLSGLRELLASAKSPVLAHLPPFHGGLVGYVGYDVVREVERLPNPPPDDRGLPDAVLWIVGEMAAFDHWRQTVTLISNVWIDASASSAELRAAWRAAQGRLDQMAADLASVSKEESRLWCASLDAGEPEGMTRTMSADAYCGIVERAREYIRAGDIFQVVLSQRFDFDLACDPFFCYRVLRQLNPSPYMYFLRHPDVCLVGSSPESMVKLAQGRVMARPVAGTRPRGHDEESDRRLEAELRADPKELAEHVMLVDLARNDIGRVVEFGSERVDELMVTERYSHVMHLTSQVSGKLRPGLGPADVLAATLPAGTVSGAPKVRAMEIIDELETTRRGPYAGVVCYIDFTGNLDTAIAIRTMVVRPDGKASVQAGAGIVADSQGEREEAESRSKAAGLLVAAKAAMGAAWMSAEQPRADESLLK
jgi:anthranilate synthase component 1